MDIYQRLFNAQNECAYLKNDGRNTHQKFNYTSHDRVTEYVGAILNKHGVLVWPRIAKYEVLDQKAILLVVDVQFYNAKEPDEMLSISVPCVGHGTEVATGRAFSYAFKYALLKAMMLPTGDDPDRDVGAPEETKQPAPAPKPTKPKETAPDDATSYESHVKRSKSAWIKSIAEYADGGEAEVKQWLKDHGAANCTTAKDIPVELLENCEQRFKEESERAKNDE